MRGRVRFEPEAVRRVIRDHTREAGVSDLARRLALICREAARRGPATSAEPAVVTPAVVAEVLGGRAGDGVPPIVREAVAAERRRAGAGSPEGGGSAAWIDWLEHLPWARVHEEIVDLQTAREALDIGHAVLDDAKAAVVEHLAARRRAPRGRYPAPCFVGPPGVGKTSLARGVARALGRACAEVACGGLRDAADVRGRPRTRPSAGPGAILRELRRAGYRDAVFVLDGVDGAGPDAAAALADALDPERREGFRDDFIEVDFDLSEVVFIATAEDWSRVPAGLRDRLEAIELPRLRRGREGRHRGGAPGAGGRAGAPAWAPRRSASPRTPSGRSSTCTRSRRACGSSAGASGPSAGRSRSRARPATRRSSPAASPRRRSRGGSARCRITGTASHASASGSTPRRSRRPRGPRCREVFERLPLAPAGGAEHARLSDYLECVAALPWDRRTDRKPDPSAVRKALDGTHAGLDAAKERLVDEAAAHALRPGSAGPAVCLAGPSGTGKTSLARGPRRGPGPRLRRS